MQNNAKIGGILSIVAGGLGCLSGLMLVLFSVLMGVLLSNKMFYNDYHSTTAADFPFAIFAIVYAAFGVVGILVSILAIIGGVYGIKKKNWGLALAGAIAGVITFFPCGVVAVIFTSMSKPEFDTTPAVRT